MSIAPRDSVTAEGETSLRVRFQDIRDRIDAACDRSGRSKQSVILVAVTKHASMDQIRTLMEMGHADLGENRVQHLEQRAAQLDEFLKRHKQLGTPKSKGVPDQARWHMIGHLQRNKVRKVVNLVRLIHTVDSLRLAEEIQAAATRREEPIEVLVQVNVVGESQKHGVAPAAAHHLIEQMDTMLNVRPRGLMCMAPAVENPEDARNCFQQCHELFDDISKTGVAGDRFDILSMGMSDDFEVAVECGANIVRVGRAIFGEKPEED
jgi:hypothetical protein